MEAREFSARTVDDALTEALIQMETTSDRVEYEVVDKGSNGVFGIGRKPAIVRVWMKKEEIQAADTPEEFVRKVCQAMGLDVTVDCKMDETEKILDINIEGESMGILIGKRGQTLDSLQYLAGLVANKGQEEYIRVKLDTENYRERRKETLENLARNISSRVKRTRKSVALEPMNPYERRIIHSALQNDKYVVTRSEGEEPYRYVIISLKRDKPFKSTGKGGYNRNNRFSSYGNKYKKNSNRQKNDSVDYVQPEEVVQSDSSEPEIQ